MKCGRGFGDHSQDGELARWGLGRDTKWRSCYAQKRLRNAKPGNHLKCRTEYFLPYVILLTELEVRTVSYGPSFFPLIYGPSAKRAGHKSTGKNEDP